MTTQLDFIVLMPLRLFERFYTTNRIIIPPRFRTANMDSSSASDENDVIQAIFAIVDGISSEQTTPEISNEFRNFTSGISFFSAD